MIPSARMLNNQQMNELKKVKFASTVTHPQPYSIM